MGDSTHWSSSPIVYEPTSRRPSQCRCIRICACRSACSDGVRSISWTISECPCSFEACKRAISSGAMLRSSHRSPMSSLPPHSDQPRSSLSATFDRSQLSGPPSLSCHSGRNDCACTRSGRIALLQAHPRRYFLVCSLSYTPSAAETKRFTKRADSND